VAWAFTDLSTQWRHRREILGAGMALVLAALAWIAWHQTSYWRDSESLWAHTQAVTPENAVVHNNLGEVLYKRGQTDEALSHYEKALEIRSRNRTSRYDFLLGLTHANLGSALRRKGLLDEAIVHYQKAVEMQPGYPEGYLGLGSALNEKGRTEEAITALRKAVASRPAYAEAYIALGDAFLNQRKDQEAIAQYQRALEIAPDAVVPLNNLAWLFATSADDSIRNGPKAVVMAERAVQVSGGQDPLFLHKLAAAYAATGDFPRAEEIAQRAQRMALDQANTPLANELERNISIYRTNNALSPTKR
jgi:tetratricopeptide (TPR) repeat protein